ncbi:hypothetical protein TorRG33x02_282330, partial [Trema orientale]
TWRGLVLPHGVAWCYHMAWPGATTWHDLVLLLGTTTSCHMAQTCAATWHDMVLPHGTMNYHVVPPCGPTWLCHIA